jgi:hypothetical protein
MTGTFTVASPIVAYRHENKIIKYLKNRLPAKDHQKTDSRVLPLNDNYDKQISISGAEKKPDKYEIWKIVAPESF